MSKNVVTLKSGQRSLKVTENYTIQSGTDDFLLTFHSNHRPISHGFRYNFSHLPCILRPCWRGYPWNWIYAGVRKKL